MKTRPAILILLIVFLLTGVSWSDTVTNDGQIIKSTDSKKVSAKNAVLAWLTYDEGLKQAKESGKNVFLEFTSDRCGYCRKMHATTFKDLEIISMLNDNFVAVSVNGNSRDSVKIDGLVSTERGVARDYRVSAYPTFWFLTPEGERITTFMGYQDKDFLYPVLDYMKDDSYKTVKFEDYLKQQKRK
jgi:thioredoxin-related protein